MGAVSRNLTIEQGVTWSTAWEVHLDGEPLDPGDGWAARSQVRATRSPTAAVLHEFTCTVTDSVVRLSVSPEESAAWLWRRGVFDVELFDTANPPRVVRLIKGFVQVDMEVTR